MKLKLKNIGKLDTAEFNIKPGITVVLGSNGQGKSTLVNALFLALTGDNIDNCTLDEKVTWGMNTGTVDLITDNWSVSRTIGKKSSVLLENTDVHLTKKAEVNDYILNWYNVPTPDIIKEVNFSAQYKATDILEATPASRLSMLASVFGFAKYEKASKLLYQHLTQLPEISYNETVIQDLQSKLEASKSRKEQLTKDKEAAEADIATCPELEEVLPILNAPTIDDIEKYKQDKQNYEYEISVTQEELDGKMNFKNNIITIKNKLQTYDNYVSDKERLSTLEAAMVDIENNMPHASVQIRELLDSDTAEKIKLEGTLKSLEEQRDMLKDGVCPLSKAPPCSELLAIADPEATSAEIHTIKEQIKILSDNIVALKSMLTASEEAYKQYVANDAEQAVLKARLSIVPEDIKDYDPTDDRKALEQASTIDIKAEIAKSSEKLEKQKTELLRINEKLNNPNAKTLEEKQQAKVMYEKRIDLANKIAGIDAELSIVSKDIDTTESMLTRMLEDKEKAEESNFKRTVYTLTRQVLSRDYLPRMLMENAIKQLNAHMLYYINLFNFPYTCQVFPDGSFMYSDDQGEWHHTKLLSGGQKYLVSIVLKLASAATLKTNFPFYVLDEPTTGLDTENRRLLADLFKDMEAKIHPLYLIIPTHDTEIADVASNVIDLRKEN